MTADYSTEMDLMTIPTPHTSTIDADNKIGHFLYQFATIGAILLFMLSFWSC